MIDIQFELLQIFPFSVKLSVLRSARCRTSEIFLKMLFADVKTSVIDLLMTLFWIQRTKLTTSPAEMSYVGTVCEETSSLSVISMHYYRLNVH